MTWLPAIGFVVLSYLFGDALVARFLPRFQGLVRTAAAYLVGCLLSTWGAFVLARAFHPFTEQALGASALVTGLILAAVILLGRRSLARGRPTVRQAAGLLAPLALGVLLFSHTFGYDTETRLIRVSRLIWSDYGFHVPLIRSFSVGHNFDLEHPLFAHESVRYHFLFDFRAGLLEAIGLPLDHAINIDGALSWTAFLLMLHAFSARIFWGNRGIGLTSVFLFLLNSSLSWVEFLKKHRPTSLRELALAWWNLSDYLAWGPWDGKPISAFWTWNIYINQRHLLSGFGLALVVLYYLVDRLLPEGEREPDGYPPRARRVKRPEPVVEGAETPPPPVEPPPPPIPWTSIVFAGILAGLLMFWHGSAYVGLVGMMGLLFLFFPRRRETLTVVVVALVLGFPQVRWFQQPSAELISHPLWHPGFLAENHLLIEAGDSVMLRTLSLLVTLPYYWFMNLGLAILVVPAAFFLVDVPRRRLLVIFSSLFAITNLFQFGSELATNHKFINLWVALTSGFMAYLLARLWRQDWAGRAAAAALFFFLTLSGVVELPAIKNVGMILLPDHPQEAVEKWVLENTDRHSVFLTPVRLYHPVGLAGRRAMVGWGYFAESAGYRKGLRGELVRGLFSPVSKEAFCAQIGGTGIDYVETEVADDNVGLPVDQAFFERHFTAVFESPHRLRERIYDVRQMCPGIRP